MRLPAIVETPFAVAEEIGLHGLIVRGLMAVAVVGCWAVAAAVGEVNVPATVVLVVVGIAAMARPDSGAPLAVIVTLIALWILEVRPVSVGWSLVLGLCVLVVHAAAARAAALGRGAALGASVARRWIVQTTVVAAATTVLWALVVLLSHTTVSGRLAVSAAAFVAVAAFAVAVAWVVRGERAADPADR
jgi:hypothetical protein